MATLYQKVVRFYFRYEPVIIVSGVLVGAHIGWRKIQDIPGANVLKFFSSLPMIVEVN